MAVFLFANNALSTLAGPITNVATSANLAAGTGVLFPNPGAGQQFALTFISAANPLLREIVYVTSMNNAGDQILTMVRGQENTAAQAWNAGDGAQNLNTAGTMQGMAQLAQFNNSTEITASGAFVTTTGMFWIGLKRTVSVAASSTTLPSGAIPGQSFTYQDLAANFNAFPLTVTASPGSTIAGLSSAVLQTDRGSWTFAFYADNTWGYTAQ